MSTGLGYGWVASFPGQVERGVQPSFEARTISEHGMEATMLLVGGIGATIFQYTNHLSRGVVIFWETPHSTPESNTHALSIYLLPCMTREGESMTYV